MKPVEIKIKLLRRGISISELARKFGCRRQELSMCIRQVPGRIYPEIRRQLATELGMTVEQLFGEVERRKAA